MPDRPPAPTTETASEQTCAKCGQRPGVVRWVGDGGSLALSHGFYEMWCHVCVLDAQIAYAEERANALPALIAQRDAARAGRVS